MTFQCQYCDKILNSPVELSSHLFHEHNMHKQWRLGRKSKHNVYEQYGPEPSDTDRCVGHFHLDEDALLAVESFNTREYDKNLNRRLVERSDKAQQALDDGWPE